MRLRILDTLESTLCSPEQATRAHCRDICMKNYSFQLASAYSIGFCGLEDESKSKHCLQDSSCDCQCLNNMLGSLRTQQLSLSYTGEFEKLRLTGFIHLVDFTEQSHYSNADDTFDEKSMRKACASECRLGAANIFTVMLKQTLASIYKSKSQF